MKSGKLYSVVGKFDVWKIVESGKLSLESDGREKDVAPKISCFQSFGGGSNLNNLAKLMSNDSSASRLRSIVVSKTKKANITEEMSVTGFFDWIEKPSKSFFFLFHSLLLNLRFIYISIVWFWTLSSLPCWWWKINTWQCHLVIENISVKKFDWILYYSPSTFSL